MKKLNITIRCGFLIVLILLSFQVRSYSQLKFQIEGNVDNSKFQNPEFNINHGDKITLDFINCDRSDTATVLNGKFNFNGDVEIPSVAMLNYKGGGLLLLIDESTYNVSIAIMEEGHGRYSYGDTNIETKSRFYHLWRSLSMNKGRLSNSKKELQDILDKDDLGEMERVSYEMELEEVLDDLSNLYFKASIENPSSYEMTYLLPGAPDFSYSRYINYYNKLPDAIKNSYYGEQLYKRLLLTKPQ